MATSESLRRIDHDRRLGSTVSTELTDCEKLVYTRLIVLGVDVNDLFFYL